VRLRLTFAYTWGVYRNMAYSRPASLNIFDRVYVGFGRQTGCFFSKPQSVRAEQHHCARPRVERIGFHGLLASVTSAIESECARNMDRKHQGHDTIRNIFVRIAQIPPAHKHGAPNQKVQIRGCARLTLIWEHYPIVAIIIFREECQV